MRIYSIVCLFCALALLVMAVIATTATLVEAQAQPNCWMTPEDARVVMKKELDQGHIVTGEVSAVRGGGAMPPNAKIMMYVEPDGAWSMLLSLPNGYTCMWMVGSRYWFELPPQL